MKMRLVILLAALSIGSPSWTAAQQGDRQQVLVEAIRHMRAILGTEMVVDKNVEAIFAGVPDLSGRLPEILTQAQVQMVDSRVNRRCTTIGNAYFTGPEKYLSFGPAHVVDGIATVRVAWSYSHKNGDHMRMSTWSSVLHFEKAEGRWTMTREGNRDYLHIADHYCE